MKEFIDCLRSNIMRRISIKNLIESKYTEQIDKIGQFKQEGIDKTEQCKEEIKDFLKKMTRQDTNLTAEFQSNTEEAKKLNSELQNTQSLIQDNLKYQLEEVKQVLQESMKLRQGVNEANTRFDREIEKWQDFTIRFLDTMERTLEYLQDNNSPSIKDIEKVIDIFSKDVRDLGIEVISPKQNEDFSPEFHEYVGEEETEGVDPENVSKCNKWGYKVNGTLYKGRRAKVIISKPIQSDSEGLVDITNRIQTDTTVIISKMESTSKDSADMSDQK
jgi:molecular chaperone GrpE